MELKTAPDSIQQVYREWINPPKIQLYDLARDPLEFHDLSGDRKYDQIKKRMLAALLSWQKKTDDPLRFPDKLRRLSAENDTIKTSKHMVWQYPHYLYGN